MTQNQTLILGGPGAGKTTELLGIMEQAMEEGLQPSSIAFVSFTRAAVQEAKDRATKRFNLSERDLPYFRTLHSLAFRELGLTSRDVLSEEHLGELSAATGELINDLNPMLDSPATRRNADELLTIDHLARTTKRGLENAWQDHGGDVDWFRLKRFSDTYRSYKRDWNLMDFTDMLTAYAHAHVPPAPVKLAILDEAQDFTLAQYDVARKAFADADDVYYAGDDLQSIHRWAGAAEEHFLNLPFQRRILPLSHRLPKSIFDLAESVASRVERRYAKEWRSQDRAGRVEWINRPEEVDLSTGKWLLLARTRAQLNPLAQMAREQGVVYRLKGEPSVKPAHIIAIKSYEALRAGKRVEASDVSEVLRFCGVTRELKEASTYTAAELKMDCTPIWHDALIRLPLEDREYYLACRRRGEKLDGEPRVRIETIHGAKGAEAENVLLSTDLTYRTQRGYRLDPDSEHRVFYVGLTRASETLYLVAPKTAYGFPL
jgi:superfamily I DNA/RNA helicase